MKPYCGKHLSNKHKIFNYRISRARQTVECTFGIYSNKFNIFHTALCMLPETVDVLVAACVCLHNFIMTKEEENGEKIYSLNSLNDIDRDMCRNNWHSNATYSETLNTCAGLTQRDLLCNYFVSAGEVAWQNNFIRRGLYKE